MEQQQLDHLSQQVQRNCHIVDANHATDYGLCIYLIKMREFYRWESSQGFTDSLPQQAVGEWLERREELWEQLREEDFAPLEIDGKRFDPFDNQAINQALQPHGLAYSGGLGRAARPHFFLGELERRELISDAQLLVVGREYARDLAAPPAMSRDETIFLRRESLRRMLWEKLENWRWSKADNPMARAFACYDFENDLEGALEAMTEVEISGVINHERGETLVGEELGDEWNEMLQDLADTPAELMARAIRDHWADCAQTLPALIRQNHPPSLHFYAGSLGGMRKELFPGLLAGYEAWFADGSTTPLEEITRQGQQHWPQLARELLEIWRQGGVQSAKEIAGFVRERRLA
jgi:hypothetical protein